MFYKILEDERFGLYIGPTYSYSLTKTTSLINNEKKTRKNKIHRFSGILGVDYKLSKRAIIYAEAGVQFSYNEKPYYSNLTFEIEKWKQHSVQTVNSRLGLIFYLF